MVPSTARAFCYSLELSLVAGLPQFFAKLYKFIRTHSLKINFVQFDGSLKEN